MAEDLLQMNGVPDTRRDFLSGLNDEQREAVLHDLGPMLILAGAGSGKTRVITHRIAYLIEERGVSPYAILAITFTNKAANEMKERVCDLIGDVASSMWIGTFHSMFARILRRHADLIGYTSDYSIADSSDQQQMMRQLIRERGLDEKKIEPRLILNRISAAKNALVSPEKYASFNRDEALSETIAELYKAYQTRMAAGNCMDFDDILVNTVRLFEQEKAVLEQYQERFRYILVDEYQDTNQAQYRIVRALAAAHKNICVVGDDDQSIYAFRGADIRNILDFEKDYPDCRVIKLERNYRSTAAILNAANAVIAHNKGRKKKKLWTGKEKGEKIAFIRANNHFDESRYIAREIERRMQKDKSLTYNDFAVLYRANALSRGLEQALRESGVPYRIYSGLRFYDRKEIKDVLAYLRLVASDRDEISFLRVVNTPRRGVGAASVETLQRLSRQTGLPMLLLSARASEFPELGRAARALSTFAELIFTFRRTLAENKMPFEAFVQEVQEESGLLAEIVEQKSKGREDAAERIENMKELLTDALEFSYEQEAEERSYKAALRDFAESGDDAGALSELAAPSHVRSLTEALQAFLARASLYSEMDKEGDEEDFVRLMTIHAAKGLEFRYVFLLCAENNVFPSSRSMNEPQSLEEERRLAYVAITRAQEKLYITTARSRMLYGQTLSNPVSIFVREIPESLLEQFGGSIYDSNGAAAYRAAAASPSGSRFGAASPTVTRGGAARDGRMGMNMSQGFIKGGLSGASSGATFTPKTVTAETGPLPQYLKPSDLQVGMKLCSKNFGVGELQSFELVAGDAIVVVKFAAPKPKRLMLSYAKLYKP